MQAIRVEERDGGLELVLAPSAGDLPPLAQPDVRRAILAVLADLPAGLSHILIRAERGGGFAGPDLPLTSDVDVPDFATLCAAIAGCPVPVVCLVEGEARGRGAAVVLAAAHRLAMPGARIAFPEVSFGLLPGQGVTQRLPRLIGAGEALRILSSGAPVGAAEALALGLFDAVIDAPQDALAAVRGRVPALLAVPRRESPGLRDGRAYLRQVAAARAGTGGGPLHSVLIDCVEAALLLPPALGLSFEADRMAEVAARPEAAALCQIARAERRLTLPPEALPRPLPGSLPSLGVIGADPALAGLVLTALARGAVVVLTDPSRDRLAGLLQTVAARQEAAVAAGQLSPEARDADWARLTVAEQAAAVEGAGLVIAASDMPLPAPRAGRVRLALTRGPVPEGALRLTLTGRAAELALPSGLRSPAGPDAAAAWAFLRRLGLWVVLTGPQARIGVSGRLAAQVVQAALALRSMGVAPEDVAAALDGLGLRMSLNAVGSDTPKTGRFMGSEEIRDRILGAMANEGARLVQTGVIATAEEVDLVAIHGLGLRRDLGGPMHHGDAKGMLILRRDLTRWQEDAPIWAPAPALDAFVSLGRGFAGAVRIR